MSIRIVKNQKGGYLVDIRLRLASGRRVRERVVSPLTGKSATERWAQDRVTHLLKHGEEQKAADVPTLEAFAEEFVNNYATTNNKASELAAKKSIIENHLKPALGRMKLDAIGVREVETFKAKQIAADYSPKSVNNQLAVLGKMLRTAVRWKVLEFVTEIQPLKVAKPPFDFLTFDEAPRLIAAADSTWATMILVAMRTGLRVGELRALRWADVDLVAGRLVVNQSAWKMKIGTPKGGRSREVPLSSDAREALRKHKHLRGEFVFCKEGGALLTENECKHPLWRACKRAGLRKIGWHALRHTFASHLVMRGVTLKAVQELLGHTDMKMTLRYAHLAPEVRSEAVNLLDAPAPVLVGGSREAVAK